VIIKTLFYKNKSLGSFWNSVFHVQDFFIILCTFKNAEFIGIYFIVQYT